MTLCDQRHGRLIARADGDDLGRRRWCGAHDGTAGLRRLVERRDPDERDPKTTRASDPGGSEALRVVAPKGFEPSLPP